VNREPGTTDDRQGEDHTGIYSRSRPIFMASRECHYHNVMTTHLAGKKYVVVASVDRKSPLMLLIQQRQGGLRLDLERGDPYHFVVVRG
jgi:hypothetical protein